MGTHKGIIYAAYERLNTLMAIGESRHEAKQALYKQMEEDPLIAMSTGKMHSYKTREKYQNVVMNFIRWCKVEQQIYRLEIVDARAEELVTMYVSERLALEYAPDTLQADRSGLRMFFQNWELAEDVLIPPRRWQDITRSRHPAARDQRIGRDMADPVERFLVACGMRRDEACCLKVMDIEQSKRSRYQLEVVVRPGYGKGGRPRRAPVYPGREQDIRAQVAGRAPNEPIFPKGIDSRLNPQAQRRQYAQDFYQLLSGRELPPRDRRLSPADYDRDAVLEVSGYLGHNRIDVMLKSYLR